MQGQLTQKLAQIALLNAQLQVLRRAQFGRSSEQVDRHIHQLELQLEELEINVSEISATLPEPLKIKQQPRRREHLPDHLPREEHRFDVGCQCPECGGQLTHIGDDVAEGRVLARSALTALKGQFDGVFTPNETTTTSVLLALEHLPGHQVLVNVGFDMSHRLLEGVINGQFSALIADSFAACQFPEEFTPPGRLLDKLASNEYGIILAQGEQGELAGGLIWHADEGRMVACFGPYLAAVTEPEQLATALCEKVAEQFGRSNRLGLVLYAPQQPPAAAGFEAAGSLAIPGGTIWTGYRMLAEEFGSDAAVAAELMPFYTDWCSSMALARNIRAYHDDGETANGLTLFATRLNRSTGMARLTPLLVGRDAEAVLAEHLQLLDQEQFSAIYCTVDTGRPFDALLAPHLLKRGFTPRMLVPWGGTGDLIHLYRAGGSR